MQLTEEKSTALYTIRAYEPNQITINDELYTNNLIVSTHAIFTNWRPEEANDLQPADFDLILEAKPEVVLIGTGQIQVFPETVCLKPLIDANIGYEIMNTLAACRTFNLLANEQREVVAALMLN